MNSIIQLVCGVTFIICGAMGLGLKKKNASELVLFTLELMVGIYLIYFLK